MIDWRKKFKAARSSAEARGIAWRLTYEEWLSLWLPYEDQLRNGEKLHLCRYQDQGAYELGNVRVDTAKANLQEAAQFRIGIRYKPIKEPPWRIDLEAIMRQTKDHWIKQAYHDAQGNKTVAAEMLGITYRAFRYYFKQLEDDTIMDESTNQQAQSRE